MSNTINKSNTYLIEMILFQGQITTQYYISSGTPAQIKLELFSNILFPSILKIDLQNEDKSVTTVYSNESLINNLEEAKKDFINSQKDDDNESLQE